MDEVKQAFQTDHDLLITLNVRVADLITTIKDLKDTANKDIGALQAGKVDKSEFSSHITSDRKDFEVINKTFDAIDVKYNNHESEIKSLNKYIWIGVGGLAVLQIAWPFILGYFKK